MADEHDRNESSIRTRQTIRIVVWVVAVAAVVIFAAANSQEVPVDWVFGDTDLALWIVIAGSALVGAIIGYVARWRRD
ncbi:LapA family protein [Ilumatobacter nonamiensis]|uniref:LapA family protein n=1 Tax=Ilumatobacter nonamiensis TaxID=467093 RepID=UPI0011D1E816|nr:LapA family protein [Ilumatobacter nonamiensis]